MKINFVSFLCICLLFACEAELPEDPIIPDPSPEDPFTFSEFLPGININKYVISDKLFYLGIEDGDRGNYILVFDTESETVIKEIPLPHEKFRFIGKVDNALYVAGDKRNAGGEFESFLVLLDIEGEIIAEYSSSNSCLPVGYEFESNSSNPRQAVDGEGNFWADLYDRDTYQKSPPFSPIQGLMRFNPGTNTCTYWNTDNSSIPGNWVLSIKPFQNTVYFIAKAEGDSTLFLMRFDNQGLHTIMQTEPMTRRYLDFRINEQGLSHYQMWGGGMPRVLKKANGSDIITGMDTSLHELGYLDYYENPNRRDIYVMGTGWTEVTYSNYDPYDVSFSFLSVNGIELMGYPNQMEGLEDAIYGEMYVFPEKEKVLWNIGAGYTGLLKLTFPD